MSQNVSRLKELLFESEHASIAELHRRLDLIADSGARSHATLAREIAGLTESEARERIIAGRRLEELFDRVGTQEKLSSSVAAILDQALRKAEVAKHEQMSHALAPLVVRTIKVELRNSQDEMVEALYPITGRLVKSYVASAMKDMMDQINRKLERGLLKNPVMLRLRSLVSGRSMAELALVETQGIEVEELFLIRRGTGELVRHWPEERTDQDDRRLSGILTAINEFAASAFKEEGGAIRSIEVDDYTVYLRPSPLYLLAARCRGTAAPGVERLIDDSLIETIGDHREVLAQAADGGAEDEDHGAATRQLLKDLAGKLETRITAKQEELAEAAAPRNPLKVIAIALALPLVAWIGWMAYVGYVTDRVRTRANAIIATTSPLTGYPVNIEVARGGKAARLLGLAPNSEVKQVLIERLRTELPETIIADQLSVLPLAVDVEPSLQRVRRSVAELEAEARRAEVRRAIERATRRLEQVLPDLDGLEAVMRTDGERRIARETARAVHGAIAALRAPRTSISGQRVDPGVMAAIGGPLLTVTQTLDQAADRLSGLIGGPPRAPTPQRGPSQDAGESAEILAAAAERLATLAVAVSQAVAIKPPPALPAITIPVRNEPSAFDRLVEWTRTKAIFFANGTDYRSEERAGELVGELAALMRSTTALIRVVGYTDERGSSSRNSQLSINRAERVVEALVERGVPRNRLVAVGRTFGLEISPQIGPQSPNRRVSFEIGFEGEGDGKP
jgi:outer membrane protein OmpA-like peptidoglycan-associated protein